MAKAVVDTNVLIIAAGGSAGASTNCRINCIEVIEALKSRGTIVVDTSSLIVGEYKSNLVTFRDGSWASSFIIWLHDHLYDNKYVERVPITPTGRTFAEFPNDPALSGFDPADHKFVATALSGGKCRRIYQGLDTGWVPFEGALKAAGVDVKYVCLRDLAAILKRRSAQSQRPKRGRH